ncbi:MAG: protein translocase subunit SecD [Actinobacteria bacterium]|nr:protein translocase subunit SecD [Actinomycetota bacterium]
MTRRLAISLIGLLVVVLGSFAGNLVAGNQPALGLDLQGGISVTQEPIGEFDSVSLDLAVERIRERIDSLGVAEPEIIRQGNAIVVNLPGVANQEEALRLVQVTGAVLLRPVLGALQKTPTDPNASTTTSSGSDPTTTLGTDSTIAVTSTLGGVTTTIPAPTTTLGGGPSRSLPMVASTIPGSAAGSTDAPLTTSSEPSDTVVTTDDGSAATEAPTAQAPTSTIDPSALLGDPSDPNAIIIVDNTDGSETYQLGPAFGTGEVFNNDAKADIIQSGWGVRVTLRSGSTGADLWNIGAAQCFAKTTVCPTGRMAIVLDGVVQSAPNVNQPSFSGGVEITGNFKESDAKDLARVLKSGSLPVRLEVQAVQFVSPTLGEDSLHAAIVSGLIGVGLVLLFMLLYYRSLALVVVLGIVLSGLTQWNVISLLSSTNGLALSLAGIAGIIVSVGVTVDSYVVFFEKLKDELKTGRSLKNSAERGFKSAWRTILAADIVSLIGAFTLWYLTVGSVRGFAFFLGLSTMCDIVIAWFFTRPTMLLLSRSKRLQRGRFFGIDNTVQPVGGA